MRALGRVVVLLLVTILFCFAAVGHVGRRAGRLLAALLLLALVVSPALGALTIPVGTHYVFPGQQQAIFFDVDGGNAVARMDFCIQLGDGGPENGGTEAMPKITDVSLTAPGTLFASNPYGLTLKKPDPAAPAKIWWIEVQSQPNTTVPAQGTMAQVTVNTAGTSVGQKFQVRLKDVWPMVWGSDLYTTFQRNTPPYQIDPTTTNGWIVISNLHTMTWNGAGDGKWGDATWSDNATFPPPYDQPPLGPPPPPAYPNQTADVLINPATVTTVTIDAGHASRQANSLTLANKGRLSIDPGKTLTVTGHVTISDEAQFTLQSGGGIGAGVSAATIHLSGGVLEVVLVSGFVPKAGDEFDLLDGAISGTFDHVRLPALGNGLGWDTSALYTTGTIGVVPEPSVLALLTGGAIGLTICIWCRRRRRR